MIVPIQILSTKDSSKRNSNNLQRDLDIMIINKRITGISMNDHTSLLYQTYGYKLNGKLLI